MHPASGIITVGGQGLIVKHVEVQLLAVESSVLVDETTIFL
jgi:hypothetical protein